MLSHLKRVSYVNKPIPAQFSIFTGYFLSRVRLDIALIDLTYLGDPFRQLVPVSHQSQHQMTGKANCGKMEAQKYKIAAEKNKNVSPGNFSNLNNSTLSSD